MMIRRHEVFIAAGIVVLLVTSAVAQAPPAAQGPPPATNLQILPKDMPREQIIQTMQAFSQALGVQCNYCHVFEGRGGRNDMASDEKPTKKTARQMLLFAREINEKLPVVVTKTADSTTRVGCMTCHRGVAIPKPLAQVLSDTVNAKGLDAAVAQYRELRTTYFGGMAYDFSELGLINMAQAATNADKADNAVAWLNLNLEFYPKSSRTYMAMAQAHQRKNDKTSAIKDLEKAVELDPNNAQARQQLQQLKGV
jgi:Photosynthetic reaction centre cytochrome C subunit/Tetratricopeptide repeat